MKRVSRSFSQREPHEPRTRGVNFGHMFEKWSGLVVPSGLMGSKAGKRFFHLGGIRSYMELEA